MHNYIAPVYLHFAPFSLQIKMSCYSTI